MSRGTPITSEEERRKRSAAAVRKYESTRWRVNLILPADTKDRIEALNTGKSNTAFLKDVILTELDRLEKVLK